MLFNLSKNGHRLHPFLESIASQIRLQRSILPELIPLEGKSEFINVKGGLEGKEVFISNELHQARGLRRIHIESALLGGGLEILHCVFFPNPTFNIPIFGVDIVATANGISAAIVDLSPVSKNLPLGIDRQLSSISFPSFRKARELPEWGNIFSRYVQFVRLDGKDEQEHFLHIVDHYLCILINTLSQLEPDLPNANSTIERIRFQNFYCLQQKRNDKTRNVLAKTFTPQWADRYIETFLFESPLIL